LVIRGVGVSIFLISQKRHHLPLKKQEIQCLLYCQVTATIGSRIYLYIKGCITFKREREKRNPIAMSMEAGELGD
jgi:hypothetical protein